MKLGLAEAVILFLATEGLIQIAKADDGVRIAVNRPPDYFQAVHSEDLILLETRRKALALKSLAISIFVSDTVLNDADPSLKKSDTFGDGEISIAVDPKNTDRVVMSATSPPAPCGSTSSLRHPAKAT